MSVMSPLVPVTNRPSIASPLVGLSVTCLKKLSLVNMSAEYRDRCCKNKKHENSKVFFCNDTQEVESLQTMACNMLRFFHKQKISRELRWKAALVSCGTLQVLQCRCERLRKEKNKDLNSWWDTLQRPAGISVAVMRSAALNPGHPACPVAPGEEEELLVNWSSEGASRRAILETRERQQVLQTLGTEMNFIQNKGETCLPSSEEGVVNKRAQ
ncbi:hypothetical protein llap_17493 [Limosa lapponica baueri]|uniref:Interleukin-7 n=1 Tax=Limosa lapponica baueri TaxID=1758121 RepID=A0A2I0TEH0_LIMLA|nr:hypothetical protein llap_17493 [Limosa lapponica baueri]